MLGRAAAVHKASESKGQKNDLAKQLFPSSSPAQDGNIQEQFKKAKQSSQSIGGFMGGGYTNSSVPTINTLHSRSPNIRQGLKSKSSSCTFVSSRGSLPKVLSRQDSFQDRPDSIDLTKSDSLPSQRARIHHPPPPAEFQIDPNDFDDDDDLDFNDDFELPKQPRPTAPTTMGPPPSPYDLPKMSQSMQPPSSSQVPSSAPSWPTSSPSHHLPPQGALKRTSAEPLVTQDLIEEDINPRPSKRRTLPWAEKKAEADEISAYEEDEEEQGVCFRCKKKGHFTSKCPEKTKGQGTSWDFTPLPKNKPEKHMPWNTTGSAVAEEKRRFKAKQKAKNEEHAAAIAGHQRGKSSMAKVTPVSLSQEQQRVLDLVVNQSKSVFFTGSAGTGKSVLMRAIIAELRKKHMREPDRIAVTASTGLAACNIGGVTLHSFGGIGLGKEDVPTLVKKIKRNQKAKNRWLRTKILIIDEISMVDGDLFDKLEGIARAMRNNGRPFGGIQLVITGDFFQLPPVPDYDNKARGVKFAFDAGTWSTAIHHTIGLTEVFRQKDPVFANMLNEMRLGKITNETIASFRKLSRRISYEDALEATELFPTRQEVENSNEYRMRSLVGKLYTFEAVDTGTITDENMREKLLANMMAPKLLKLKKGAQVMLIKNMDDGLVNGSLGSVVGFMDEKMFELYDQNPEICDPDADGDEVDEAIRNGRNAIRSSYASKRDGPLPNSGMEYPLVRFSLPDGTSRDLLVMREEWKIELPSGEVQAQRSQLPLILAWALSIHKAQGQTLERVKIDLKKIFEKGQAYVALSRATSQAGLEVQNFDKNKVMAHPRVAQFYDSLYSVNKALEHPKVAKPPAAPKVKSYADEYDIFKSKSKAQASQAYEFDGDEEEVMAAWG